MFSIGFGRNSIKENYIAPDHFSNFPTSKVSVIGFLKEDIIAKNKNRGVLSVEYLVDNKNEYSIASGNLLVYLEKDSLSNLLSAGDRILLSANIHSIKPNGNPYAFDFKNYLHKRSIDHQCFLKFDDWTLISHGNLHPIKNFTQRVRKKFLNILLKYIDGSSEEAIGAALVLGYRNLLTDQVYDAYTDTGSVHVLAVSGLHLGILTGMLLWLFSFFKSSSQIVEITKMVCIIIAIWLFALITGSAPAVLRAATMFTLFIIGKKLFKDINTYNILSASAILLLLYDPFLLSQASFQFSYLALTSILYFHPKLSSCWVPKNGILRFVWNLAVLALAAQILVFPITIYYFHKFPLYFALSGIIAVPFAGIILWISVIIFMFESLIPCVNSILGPLLNFALSSFLKLILLIQELPFCSLDGILINYRQMIIIYAFLITAMIWFTFKIKRLIFLVLLLSIVFVSSSSLNKLYYINQKELVVYDAKGGIVMDIFHGLQGYTYIDSIVSPTSIEFATTNYRLNHRINKMTYLDSIEYEDKNIMYHKGYISLLEQKILLLDKNTPIPHSEIIEVDFLVIGQVSEQKLALANKRIIAQQVILSNAIPFWKKESFIEILNHPNVHVIQNKGAFIAAL